MSDAETIKEFLVGLGFKIDESSFKKFDSAIGQATRDAFKLGSAAIGVAAAVELFVGKVAESLDHLYFASKRTGSTVGEIKSAGFAVSQLGGTFDDAKSSLEGLAMFQRLNPGAGSFLESMLGVKPENLGNAKKAMDDIAARVEQMHRNGQDYLAFQLTRQAGINDATTNAMMSGDYLRKEQEYNDMLKSRGLNLDTAAKSSMEFENQLKQLDSNFNLMAIGLETHLLPVVNWLNQKVLDLAGATNGSNKEMTWADKLGDQLFAMFEPTQALTSEEWKKVRAGVPVSDILGGGSATRQVANDNSNMPIGIRQNNPGNLRSWAGVPTENGFANFPTVQAGLHAMAEQLELYGNRGNDTLSGIASTWAPAKDRNNVAAYIADLVKNTGYSAGQHLDLHNPDMLLKVMNGMISHENGRNPYDATLVSSAATSAAGGGAILHQKTIITVHGANDAQETASNIGSAQNATNQQAVRNLAGAIQ